MRKITLTLLVLLLYCNFMQINRVKALEAIDPNFGEYKATFSVDKTSALADGKDKIKIIYGMFWIQDESKVNDDDHMSYRLSKDASINNPKPYCMSNTTEPIGSTYVDAMKVARITGTLNLVSDGLKNLNVEPSPADGYSITDNFDCNTGYGAIYLSSLKAETKSISIFDLIGSSLYGLMFSSPITVTFSSPPTTQSTSSAKPAPQQKSTATPSTPAPIKPTLTTTLIKTTSAHKTVTLTSNSTGLRTNETLTLTGTTSPNAKVTLTIQSNPITVDLTADQAGKWTYTLNPKTLKLALGSHTVTAVATSSEGIKSDPVTLATFILKTPPVQTPIKPDKYNPFNLTNYLLLGGVFILGIVLVVLIKKQKNLERFVKK